MSDEMDDVFLLEDEQHFELLTDPTRMEIIELLHRPRSVRELAEAMEVPRTRLYHHVNLLDEAGMIGVVGTRRSGAVDEKVYRTAAHTFRPSPRYLETAMPRDRAKALLTSLFGSTQADFLRAVDTGVARLENDGSERSVQVHRSVTFLSPSRLHQFVTELEALYARYDDIGEPAPDAIPVAVLGVVHPSSRRMR